MLKTHIKRAFLYENMCMYSIDVERRGSIDSSEVITLAMYIGEGIGYRLTNNMRESYSICIDKSIY